MADRMLNARQVADLVGCKPNSVYKLMARVDIPEWREGRMVRWSEADVKSYLQRGWLRPSVESRDQPENRPYERAS